MIVPRPAGVLSRSTRRRRVDHAAAVISSVFMGAALFAGCYKPVIQDGSLRCGPTDSCPDGFQCVSDFCHRSGSDGSVSDAEPKADTSIDGAPDTPGDSSDGPEVCAPRTAASGCSPQSDLRCDPVCQTGCCTSQKCSALYNGHGPSSSTTLGCVENIPTRGLGERCDVQGAATADRHDNCSPGLVCIEGNVGNFCLKLCRGDADCAAAGTKCEPRTLELAKDANSATVCGLAPSPCDPTLNGSSSGCPANLVCYLLETSESGGDKTVCEIRSGETARNLSCTRSRDCLAGLTCPTTGPGAGICRPVCSHKTTPAGCPAGTTCQTLGIDYDFCF
jgi:hypothetical protein